MAETYFIFYALSTGLGGVISSDVGDFLGGGFIRGRGVNLGSGDILVGEVNFGGWVILGGVDVLRGGDILGGGGILGITVNLGGTVILGGGAVLSGGDIFYFLCFISGVG